MLGLRYLATFVRRVSDDDRLLLEQTPGAGRLDLARLRGSSLRERTDRAARIRDDRATHEFTTVMHGLGEAHNLRDAWDAYAADQTRLASNNATVTDPHTGDVREAIDPGSRAFHRSEASKAVWLTGYYRGQAEYFAQRLERLPVPRAAADPPMRGVPGAAAGR